MTFTQEDQRDKIRSQLEYELFGAAKSKQGTKTKYKSNVGICKREKFITRNKAEIEKEGVSKMRIIYEPRGRALEYAPLAVSLYRGCSHGCKYCFAPETTNTNRQIFLNAYARKDCLKKLEADAKDLSAAKDQREILMSFTTDPYQPIERSLGLTRAAIVLFHKYNLHYTILTKAGGASTMDIDLMAERPDLCRYGATLVFANEFGRQTWEPNAAPTEDREHALWFAKDHGIRTWVSLEPVIYPEMTLSIIKDTCGYVDEYRIGKFNHPDNPDVEKFLQSQMYAYPSDQQWRGFVDSAKRIFEENACKYIFKKDLQPYLRDRE